MAAGFDGVARLYQPLEHLAFGRALERARCQFLPELGACRSVLVLGEGDGRGLQVLLGSAPHARVHVVDASAQMIALARARLSSADAARVTFELGDARQVALGAAPYDAVLTMFFLDCFSPAEVRAILRRTTAAVTPHARWLFADFAIPERGLRRLVSRVIVRSLYAFFGWRARLSVTDLPPSEAILHEAGWQKRGEQTYRFGLIRSAVFEISQSPSL